MEIKNKRKGRALTPRQASTHTWKKKKEEEVEVRKQETNGKNERRNKI